MKQQRKIDLLYSFPALPGSIAEQMKGKRAANFCVFLTNGHELFVRCYHRYTTGEIAERQRYVFAKDGCVRYRYDNLWNTWKVAVKFTEPRFILPGMYAQFHDNTYCILNANSYKESDLKYCPINEYMRFPMQFIRLYIRHPNIEYLFKAGYGHLVHNEEYDCFYRISEHTYVDNAVNLKSNNLLKMLGLNRVEFKLLKGWEKHYNNYLYYREHFPQYKPEELMELVDAYGYEHLALDEHVANSGLKPLRLARYLTDHDIEPHLYGDYLDQCLALHYDMKDTAVSLPHDFHAMHARLSQLIKIKVSEDTRRAFAKNTEKRRHMEYAEPSFFVRLPNSIEEIVHEGKVLSHCVGGYAERHAKGMTTILFIRQAAEPDKPFYTVEVDNSGKIRQCYGEHNKPALCEVKEFRERYQSYLTEAFENGKQTDRKLQQSA